MVIIPTRPKRSHNSWSYLSFYGSSHCVSEQWKPQLPVIFEGKLNNLLTKSLSCIADDDDDNDDEWHLIMVIFYTFL